MAKICVLQEGPGDQLEIRLSLEGFHELIVVESARQIMDLPARSVDLIISRVYLERGNVFAVLNDLKRSEQYRNVPFVCFSGLHTRVSRQLDPVLADASMRLGADGYIVLDNYCTGDRCDCVALRTAIERFIKPSVCQGYAH